MQDMTPDRWTQISTLLDAALDLPPGERAAFLDDACAGDDALRAEVEALLDAEAHAPPFLEDDAAALAGPLVTDEHTRSEPEGDQIGPYRLVRTIGRGGMSVVYLAERADGQFEQQVALKLLPRYLETEDRIARFRAERQILASLNHPNIAHLLDGGVTATGRPYLVMEHVEGRPITDYCAARDLSVGARLELLQAVCRAVQHAHRRLVVHRDLKPSNILVTETVEGPRVKLLDFGIAKLLAEDEVTWTAPVTRTGEHWMTPEYAAPEQVKGEAVTTATDVYQLGVLAYQVLTGQSPFDLEGKSLTEIQRVLLETDPKRPSKRVEGSARRTRRLRGDLDTIVMKALRKEPERRYASARDLGDDLDRYLEGRPVAARPATWRHRVRQFVRRHRGAVATAVLLALLLVGYAVTVTVQARRIAAERDRARQETVKAEQISDLLTDILATAGPYSSTGPDTPVREVLETGVARVRERPDLSPEVLAEVLEVAGQVYTEWSELDRARELLEQALQIADTAAVPPATRIAVLNSLGNLNVNAGAFEAAEPLLRQVLRLESEQPDRDESAVATAANDLAGVLERLGRLDEAGQLYRRAIAIRRERGEKSTDLAANLNNLANLLADQNHHAEAESLYLEALEIVETAVGDDHPYAAFLLNALSLTHKELGKPTQALEENGRALNLARERLGPEHPFTATALFNRAPLLAEVDRSGEAQALYEKVLALRRRILPENHPDIAYTLVGFGRFLLDEGRPRDAEPLLREALTIREAAYPDPHWLTAIARGHLGQALIAQQRYDEAEPLLIESHASLKAQFGLENDQTREAARRLVQFYDDRGRPAEAAQYRQALAH